MTEEETTTPGFSWQTKARSTGIYGPNGPEPDEYAVGFVNASCDQLNMSGTGLEDDVFESLAAYLMHIEHPATGDRTALLFMEGDPRRPVFALCAELAANADFVEYGTSLRTAWPTDAGRAWLASYEEHMRSAALPQEESAPEAVERVRATQHWNSKPLTEADFAALFEGHEERVRFERELLSQPPGMSGEVLPPCAVVVREGGAATGEYWAFASRMRLHQLPEPEHLGDLPDGGDE